MVQKVEEWKLWTESSLGNKEVEMSSPSRKLSAKQCRGFVERPQGRRLGKAETRSGDFEEGGHSETFLDS